MKIFAMFFLIPLNLSLGEPLSKIVTSPDFTIEITKITNVEQLHTINYDGTKVMPIPINELVKLRDAKFVRQFVIGNFSKKNGKVHVINLNRFEILNNKVLVRSKNVGVSYSLDRETLLRLLNNEIVINWNNWSDILIDE